MGCFRRNARTTRLNSSGASKFTTWPTPGNTTRSELGTSRSRRSTIRCSSATSLSPKSKSAGARICDNLSVLSDSHVVAYESALTALGYLVNRTGSERALTYLVDGLTPSVWVKRGVMGVPEWETSYAEFGKRLSKYALFGLAVSGDPRAREALIALRDSPTPAQAGFRNNLDDILATWLGVHQQVAEMGVAGMYDDADAKREAAGFRVTH